MEISTINCDRYLNGDIHGMFMSAIRGRALTFSRVVIFRNETKGYNQFLRWVKSVIATGPDLVFSMEATWI